MCEFLISKREFFFRFFPRIKSRVNSIIRQGKSSLSSGFFFAKKKKVEKKLVLSIGSINWSITSRKRNTIETMRG